MRISKRVSVIVGAVVLVVALVSVYMVYFQQAGERDDLNAQLDAAEALLPRLISQKQELQGQLASATSALETNKEKFPESVRSIEYGEYLFEIADKSGVRLESLSFPKPIAITVGPVTYSVVSLTLPVRGTLDNIFRFIDTIRTDARFASTEVTMVSINVAGSAATINIIIHGYKG